MKLFDSLTNLVNSLANKRSAIATNEMSSVKMSEQEMRAIYKSGIGSKICRLKAGYALNNTIQFQSANDEIFYNLKLAKHVKKAAKLSIGFGRSVILILEKGGNLTQPLPKNLDPKTTRIEVFSGDMVSVPTASVDLTSDRYQKPMTYLVRGQTIHHSRIVDFKYVEPPELDAPLYRWGGISEFELIRAQLIADGVVQRAVPTILDKNSSFFYRVEGFKDQLAAGNAEQVSEYYSKMEDLRSIYGAGIIDKEDEVETIDQTLTNLQEADLITLRRLAMVTGIPFIELVGEGPSGLNANGEAEISVKQDMIETLQSEYYQEPISELMVKMGQAPIKFKENQGQTANQRLDVETKVIANAEKLALIGEDYAEYLERHNITQKDEFKMMFDEPEDDDPVENLAQMIAEIEAK